MTSALACWTAQSANQIIATEALQGDDAVFLAIHTVMAGFDVAGPSSADIPTNDEQAVLSALSSTERQHAFCVVLGEAGSGKSHLIRWLSVKWPHAGDVKILLRRSDGSLEGALRQLKQRLPAEFESLFSNLGQAQRASSQGRANIFLSTLADSLEVGHFDPPLDDESWCAKNLPAALLRHPDVRKGWNGPSRILKLLEGGGGERNSATADFDLLDILELSRHCFTVRGSGVRPATEELARRIIAEADVITEWAAEQWTADEIAQKAPPHQVKTSLELVAALNRRRNHAIQNVLGVSAEGLKALFRQVREILAKRGQRLVLLLEDITSWEGLDDSLIDVLVFNAEVRGDEREAEVCPLISVVGLTPQYYHKLQANYRGRITHEIQLGRVTKELQDVATLRDRSARLAFASRYLAAVRAGPERLGAWAAGLDTEPDLPRPNVCLGCNERDKCVSTFGEVDGISLFPFTSRALDRLYDSLKESDFGLTWKTPRGMLQSVLLPSLAEPHRLDEGSYPGVGIERHSMEDYRRADRVLSSNRLAAIIATQMAGQSESERGRMRRTLAYWGDPDRADTSELGGELALAGVTQSLLAAFNLPWIGADRAEIERPAVPDIPASPKERADSAPEPGSSAIANEVPAPIRPHAHTASRPTTVAPKKGPSKTELERLRDELRNWSAGDSIASTTEWNKTVHLLIRSLDARSLGLPQSVLDRLVTAEMVKLEGTTSRQRNYLSIAPEEWVRAGLEAYISLRQNDAPTAADQAYSRLKLASLMRRLGGLVAAYADQRLGRTEDGRRWSPIPLLVQVLLARSWLRGAVSPSAPWSEQLRTLLSDEDVGEGDRGIRSSPWQDWLKDTDPWQARLRAELRRAMDLSLGEGQGIADLSVAAVAMLHLQQEFRFQPAPKEAADTLVAEYDAVRRLAGSAYALSRICQVEKSQLTDRGQRLASLLGGRSIAEHLAQVDQVISEVSTQIPEAAPERVSDWKKAYTRSQSRLVGDAPGRVEAFIISLEDPEVLSLERSSLLAWLAASPARDLEEFLGIATIGEQVLGLLLLSARDLIGSGGSGSLEAVRSVGRSISEVLFEQRTLGKEPNG